jgi:hypothetical protein
MKNVPRTYVLTLHSPSRQALRLWTGRGLHALRHCSVKQIERALREMQEYIADLQSTGKAAVSERSYSLNRSR